MATQTSVFTNRPSSHRKFLLKPLNQKSVQSEKSRPTICGNKELPCIREWCNIPAKFFFCIAWVMGFPDGLILQSCMGKYDGSLPTPRVSVCAHVNQSRVQPCKHTGFANLTETIKGEGRGILFTGEWYHKVLGSFHDRINKGRISFAWSKSKLSQTGKIPSNFAIGCQTNHRIETLGVVETHFLSPCWQATHFT